MPTPVTGWSTSDLRPGAVVAPSQSPGKISLAFDFVIGGEIADRLVTSLADFDKSTGIAVSYSNPPPDPGHTAFLPWIASGTSADVVLVSSPNRLLPVAKAGKIVDLNEALGSKSLKESYDQNWLDWATMPSPNGPIVAGLFTHSHLHSVVWYPKAAFDKAGYKVPNTWNEMIALSDRIAGTGGSPWGFGNLDGPKDWLTMTASGPGFSSQVWATDLLLRTASLADYDSLWKGDLKFSSPQVTKAVQTVHDLWMKPGYAYGGKDSIYKTGMASLLGYILGDKPLLWMTATPSYVPVFDAVTDFVLKKLGADYDFFTLPPIDQAHGAPVQVDGHIMAMIHDKPEARALMGYVASGAQGEAWMKQGGGLGVSPRKGAKAEWCPDALGRKVAQVIGQAKPMRFAASSLMPVAVSEEMGRSLREYLGGKATLDSALKRIDDAWAANG